MSRLARSGARLAGACRAGFGLAVLALLGGAATVEAQNTVTLHGRVTGPDGAALAGAQVAVLNRETNQQRGALSTPEGTYTIVGLPPGNYHVSVEMLGYGKQEQDIRLLVGQRATLDFQLQQAAVAVEGVEVVHRKEPVFEVQRNDVSTPVVTAEIVNLPLNTRNTINLAAIVPGVKTYAPTAGRSLPSVGSLPDLRFWNFYLDGAEWKSFFNGNLVGIPQTGSPLPQEAMREFRVHLNPYDAEYTRGGAYVISAVTQRGTNEFHGSAFAYGQNNDLNALDMFQRRARSANPTGFRRPDYSRAQFGVNVRGPIVKDRLFFAGSYEGQSTDNNIAVVPGRPAVNPGIWDAYAGTFKAPTKNHTGVLRLTAPMGSNHTLDATWAGRFYDSETNFGNRGARNSGINASYQVHSAQIRDTYTPNASFMNELSLNFLYWHHNESPLEPGPTKSYPGIQLGTSGFPLELKEKTLRLIDRATYTLGDGRHILTGGVEIAKVNTNSWNPTNRDGFFQFPTDTSTLPSLGRVGVGFFTHTEEDARAVTSGWSTGAYVQDQWQATRTLQLTFGVRWDAEINTLGNDFTVPWASDPKLQALPELKGFLNTGKRKNDLNNFAPRFSFSWDALGDGRTFVRGGAGLMYDRIATFMAFNEKVAAGWRSYDFTNPGTTDPEVLRQRVLAGEGRITPNLNLLKVDMKTPVNRQFSLGVGQQLAEGFALNVDYLHQEARNLYVQVTPNWFNTQTGHRNLTDDYGTITLYDDFGKANFDAVVAGLTYDRPGVRVSNALTLGWARATMEALGGYNDASYFIMQPTSFDERWRNVLSGIVSLPYDLKLSAVAIVAAPRPYVAILGQDLNHDNLTNNDFLNGKDHRVVRPDASWDHLYRTVDLRLSKGVSLGGDRKVSVSAEAFNIFNWNNYSGYFNQQKDAAGNPITNYGTPSGVYAPRQAQLGLRYEF